jgi:phosphoribosylformimino-5-aminoimidazole carboxamide ribotide isomerase
MLIIPAIDIKDGVVVRLVQGRRDKKVYSRDPLKTARHWVSQGARFMHLVDLDGAICGKSANLPIFKKIVRSVNIPLEIGGGVRTIERIKELLDCGFSRVVLGTKAAEDPVFLKKAFKRFKDKIIVSVDTEAGHVAVRGWQEGRRARISLPKLLAILKETGFKELIYTEL